MHSQYAIPQRDGRTDGLKSRKSRRRRGHADARTTAAETDRRAYVIGTWPHTQYILSRPAPEDTAIRTESLAIRVHETGTGFYRLRAE